MDELKQLAKLRLEQDKKRNIEEIDKPQFRLANPNQPVKLRTKSASTASMGLPPIENLLNPEQINEINNTWDRRKEGYTQLDNDYIDAVKQAGIDQANKFGFADENSNYKPLPMKAVLENLNEVPDSQLETEVSDYLHGNNFKGKDVKALNEYLRQRNQDMIFGEPDLQDDDNYFFDLYGDDQ